MARADRRGPLVRAIVQAVHRAGFSTSEILKSEIKHTDLPWQVPQLTGSPLVLEGLGLQEFCDRRESVDIFKVRDFWFNGLHNMYRRPKDVADQYGWKGTSPLMYNTTAGDRNLRFSVPEGWPEPVEYAGAMFSMEVAFMLSLSRNLKIEQTVSDYYVETPEFGPIGVLRGVPSVADSPWDIPVDGMIDALATSPRGLIITECRYDLLARLRSIGLENEGRFTDHEAFDHALQILYFLEGAGRSLVLQDALNAAVPTLRNVQRQIGIVEDCSEIMQEWVTSDRVKLLQLSERLVPEVISKHAFASLVWNFQKQPPLVLRDNTVKKIRENLTQLRLDLIDTLPEAERSIYKKDQE